MEIQAPAHTSSSRSFFENELTKARAAELAAQEQINALALARLAVFVGMLLSVWLWNSTGQFAFGAIALALLAGFVLLMKKQQRNKRTRDFQRNIQVINQDELERLSLRFSRKDSGLQFLEKEHSYATDLDIFGEYSLYKLLNRTRTDQGSRRLADWLKNHADADEIMLRQEASRELALMPAHIQEWESTALLYKDAARQVNAFEDWVSGSLPDEIRSLLKWRWWSVVTFTLLILFVLNIVPGFPVLASIGIHFLILKKFQPTITALTDKTTVLGHTLKAYADLLGIAENAPLHSTWWEQRKTRILGASDALKSVGKLLDLLDFRNNAYFAIFIGVPTFWDLHCLVALERWKSDNRAKVADWLNALADAEAMNCLGGHAFANPDAVAPVILRAPEVSVKAAGLGHPLIPSGKRISNDFAMEGTGHTILITGSNMSGKSTFLRTIGLNLVLAQIGAVVSATSFTCSSVRVFSSMRTQDSLEENTSSFYAELKRLKNLLELAGSNDGQPPVFYLLDEILKGTNSTDRHKGAEALIRQLHTRAASGLVSTHDLELGEWGAQEEYVENYHFTSDVDAGRLSFDYRLRTGICRSFNASELMRMMGIDMDLIEKAPDRI